MKVVIRLVPAVLAAVWPASIVLGQIAPGDPSTYDSVSITNTRHNLNTFPGVSIPGNQICLPCHTPHNAYPDPDGTLSQVLWNHEETDVDFTMYTTLPRPGETVGTTGVGPDGPSKMCLSCHDGVTAIDNYGNPFEGTMTGGTTTMTGESAPRAIGRDGDLTDDHPIGIVYPLDRPGEFNHPDDFAPGINNGPGVKLVTINGEARVECTSCHDPHNNGLGRFLRAPLQESWICLQCHIK